MARNFRALDEIARAWELVEDGFEGGPRWPGEPKDANEAARKHLAAADDALSGGVTTVKNKSPIDAEGKILRLLKDGPRESDEIRQRLKIPRTTFYRLRRRLGLKAIRRGFGAKGNWYLMRPAC